MEAIIPLVLCASIFFVYLFIRELIKNKKENKAKFIVNLISVSCMVIALVFWVLGGIFEINHLFLAILGVPSLFAAMLFFTNQALAEKCKNSVLAKLGIVLSHLSYLLYHVFLTDVYDSDLWTASLWGKEISYSEERIYTNITSFSWKVFVLISIIVFVYKFWKKKSDNK